MLKHNIVYSCELLAMSHAIGYLKPIVTYRPIARQRLAKHIPAVANAGDN
jgi:hypothetical protein